MEHHASVRGNRHLFAGLRIAPALPAAHHGNQYAEAAHHDAVAVRQGFRHRFKKGVDKRPALFQVYIQTGRKNTDKPRFRDLYSSAWLASFSGSYVVTSA